MCGVVMFLERLPVNRTGPAGMVGAGLGRRAAWRDAGSRSRWGVGPVRQEVQDGLEQDVGEQRWGRGGAALGKKT